MNTPSYGRRTTRRLAVAVCALALVTAACGSDDDGADEASDATEATEITDTTEATESTGAPDGSAPAGTDAPDDTSDMDDGEPFRIAVVSPSATNDLAFSQSMYDALQVLSEERELELAFSDGLFVVEDGAAAIRDYAEQGYDLVIAHGTQYGGSLEEIAPDYPEVSFAWGTASDTFGMDNVFAYTSAADEGGYVMGTMAAALTTDAIGVVGPIEAGDAKLYVDGFVSGAQAGGNSDVVVNYIGSFSDVALASEAAQSFVASGVGAMTGTAQMVVGAVGVAAAASIPWFGTQANQTQLAPDFVVASQVYHWEVVLADIIDLVESGTLGGEMFGIDFANGGLTIEFNDGYELDPSIKELGETTAAGLADGSTTTGVEG